MAFNMLLIGLQLMRAIKLESKSAPKKAAAQSLQKPESVSGTGMR